MTVHKVSDTSREMLNFAYPMFIVNEEKLTFTCELYDKKVRIFVNGIRMFLAEEPDFAGEYNVVFNDGPSTHKGKVKEADIAKSLPRIMEVIDFRIYNL